jgi:hypothetical protein
VSINKGVITLIDENGEVKNYLQRGIESLSMMKKAELGRLNLLDFNASLSYKDLPKDISLEFEDPGTQGRVYVTYSEKREKELLEASKQ